MKYKALKNTVIGMDYFTAGNIYTLTESKETITNLISNGFFVSIDEVVSEQQKPQKQEIIDEADDVESEIDVNQLKKTNKKK